RIFEQIPTDSQFLTLLRGASGSVLDIYGKVDQGVVYKDDNSPQTQADRVSNILIVQFLRRNTPFPILSEESGVIENFTEDCFWIVDPLDGTRDFMEKTGEFSIMMALIVSGRPIFGVVYQPTTEKCYMAKQGKGAFLIDAEGSSTRLNVSGSSELSKMRMVVSRNRTKGTDLEVARRLGVGTLVEHGSFGLKVGLIAEGKADLFLNSGAHTSIWDSAPNIVILKEAGGAITDLNGNELLVDPSTRANVNGVVASNGQHHLEIVGQIRKIVNQVKLQS
ncbi:MAG: 3'(2'),5'-bisphosphate nucleotidase CysQ, partial [bacterium]|nr:3'(2'),5'-bisphosphate nucleotidase CysQ [bacterium]